MNSKVIKAGFMLVIATCFSSLCLTFAWFTSNLIQENQGSNINLTGMDGTLYYYEGNHINNAWCGFLENEVQNDINPKKGFTEYIDDPADPNYIDPFQMQSAKPSSRFLFYIKASVKDSAPAGQPPMSFNVKFGAANWICEAPAGQSYPTIGSAGGEAITLARAIHFYAGEATELTQNVDPNQLAIDYADSLKKQYNLNLFTQTSTGNPSGSDPLIFKEYTFKEKTTYIIPFLMEFTNDPNTFFTGGPSIYTQSPDGDSNVYMGMKFTFTQLFLTHITPPKG